MDQDIPEPGQGGQVTGKFWRQNAQLAHAQDGIVVINGFAGVLQGDDAMADINSTLCGDFEVAFHNVAQIGVLVKLIPPLVSERL